VFKRILVAIDDSDHSRLAIPAALEVGRRFHSDVFVLHVGDRDGDGAAALVARAVWTLRDGGVIASGIVKRLPAGRVAENIVASAAAVEADLIVMGSRGLSDVEGLLLGSVTHKVLKLAPVAVLVAKGPLRVRVGSVKPMFGRRSLVAV
jgi:nucleotide-binding universal stress UspA family protein